MSLYIVGKTEVGSDYPVNEVITTFSQRQEALDHMNAIPKVANTGYWVVTLDDVLNPIPLDLGNPNESSWEARAIYYQSDRTDGRF